MLMNYFKRMPSQQHYLEHKSTCRRQKESRTSIRILSRQTLIFRFLIFLHISFSLNLFCPTSIEGTNTISRRTSNNNQSQDSIAQLNFRSRRAYLNKFLENENLNYKLAVFLAQEEAKCLQEFGERETKTLEFQSYVPFKCGGGNATTNLELCRICRNLIDRVSQNGEDCSGYCGKREVDFCISRCEMLKQKVQAMIDGTNENGTVGDEDGSFVQSSSSLPKNKAKTFILEEPYIFCEDVMSVEEEERVQLMEKENNFQNGGFSTSNSINNENVGSHVVYLRWKLRETISETTNKINKLDKGSFINFPVIFLLEYNTPRNGSEEDWLLVGKRFNKIEPVRVPYHTQKYRWRVTAISSNGIIDRAYSKSFSQTLDGFVEPGPPIKIFIAKQMVAGNESMVDVSVGWEPPPEKPCAYKINLYPMDTSEHYRTYRLTEPTGENLHMIRGLKLGTKYDVTITSRGNNWKYESTLKSQNFTTITCLEAFNYSFEKCEPLPPRNITHKLINTAEVSEQDQKKAKLSVKLSWLAPFYTSEANPISSYIVSVGPPLNDSTTNHKSILSAAYFRMNRNHNLPGNATEIFLNELLQDTQYVIKLTSISTGGRSQPVQYHLSTKVEKTGIIASQTNNWLYISISISFVILCLFGCHFIRVYLHKRKVKKARNEYFQTMEERDAISADWSIVPLNEEYSGIKLFGDYPKEKWEIEREKLILCDVIGQGAFGVVRRAKMARKDLEAVGKIQWENCFNNNDNNHNTSEGMETVAVKMLKVSATREDRDQLIKEIVTMQNLGYHPQIVSLLGACTKGRNLCLILEYCPGGDLLTFLRKVRAKYWPTLGLSDSKKTTNCSSINEQHSRPLLSRGSAGTSISSSHRKSTDSSPINYADMETFSEYSSSPDKHVPPTCRTGNDLSVHNNDIGESPPGVDIEDYCRPIDEKDVLSYARQIAIGMEYLEKNHLIHRDLAARNVLLKCDYKQVKISDFGLSRDVYTWNVYHQKSNGKLPIKWMAIESIFTHVFTSKSDVWSFGILLWELVTLGGTPYPGLANTELFQLLKSGYRMERPDNCSEELYALMKKCWRTSSLSRPNFTELRHHVETMMEAAEPSLYLSLMADLPTDYFRISSPRNDILRSRFDDEQRTLSKTNVIKRSKSNSDFKLKEGHKYSNSTKTQNTSYSAQNPYHSSNENNTFQRLEKLNFSMANTEEGQGCCPSILETRSQNDSTSSVDLTNCTSFPRIRNQYNYDQDTCAKKSTSNEFDIVHSSVIVPSPKTTSTMNVASEMSRPPATTDDQSQMYKEECQLECQEEDDSETSSVAFLNNKTLNGESKAVLFSNNRYASSQVSSQTPNSNKNSQISLARSYSVDSPKFTDYKGVSNSHSESNSIARKGINGVIFVNKTYDLM